MIAAFTRDNDRLFDQLQHILYYFRGALGRDDVWRLNPYEREKAVEYINQRMKDAGDMMKKQVPVFL